MKTLMKLSLCAAIIAAPWGAAAVAAGPSNVLAESARTVAEGRALHILVAQSEIKSDINPSNLAVATGGGMLGGLLAASQNAKRAKKAEAAIEPLRAALTGFDFDGLALEAGKASVAPVVWFQPSAVSFGKDSSPVGRSATLDKSSSGQTAFVEYTYDVSPDFSSVRVASNIQFANKTMPVGKGVKPEARLSPKNLAYTFTITSVVSLDSSSEDINLNAAKWSADGGKLARAALAKGLETIKALTPRALALTAADIKLMSGKDKPKGGAGGFAGRVQESTPAGTLLWTGGFVHAQTLLRD
jgi:hypothetical protein